MLWHLAGWAGTVLAAGVIAGLVVAAAGAAAMWLLYRRARRRLEALTRTAARHALQAAAGAAGAGRGRPVPPGLRRRTGPPGAW